jgi:hypothetical protein
MTDVSEYEDIIEDLQPFFFQKPCLYLDVGLEDAGITKKFLGANIAFKYIHLANYNRDVLYDISESLKGTELYDMLRAHQLNLFSGYNYQANTNTGLQIADYEESSSDIKKTKSTDSLSTILPLLSESRISILRLASHPGSLNLLLSESKLLDEQMVDVIVMNVSVDDEYQGAAYYSDVEDSLKKKGYSLFKVYQTKQITDWRKPYLEEVTVIYMSQRFVEENPSEWVYKYYISETSASDKNKPNTGSDHWIFSATKNWSTEFDIDFWQEGSDVQDHLHAFMKQVGQKISDLSQQLRYPSNQILGSSNNNEYLVERANIEIHSLKVAQKTTEAKLRDTQKSLLETKQKLHDANLKYRVSTENYSKMKQMYATLSDDFKRFKKENRSALKFKKIKKAFRFPRNKNKKLPASANQTYPLQIKKGLASFESFYVNENTEYDVVIDHNLNSNHPINCMLASFQFFDTNNGKMNPSSIKGLTQSDSVGFYRYVNYSPDQKDSKFVITIPPGCAKFDMKIMTWGYDGEITINQKPQISISGNKSVQSVA